MRRYVKNASNFFRAIISCRDEKQYSRKERPSSIQKRTRDSTLIHVSHPCALDYVGVGSAPPAFLDGGQYPAVVRGTIKLHRSTHEKVLYHPLAPVHPLNIKQALYSSPKKKSCSLSVAPSSHTNCSNSTK